MRTAKSLVRELLLFFVAGCFWVDDVYATHFRMGAISWVPMLDTSTSATMCVDGVTGPATAGVPCKFPFRHGGRTYTKCIDAIAATKTTKCENTCKWKRDGGCDDGGAGSTFSICPLGTDCADCGSRSIASNTFRGANGWCPTSREFTIGKNWGSCAPCSSLAGAIKVHKIKVTFRLALRLGYLNNRREGKRYHHGTIDWGDGTRSKGGPFEVTTGGIDRVLNFADSVGTMEHTYSSQFLSFMQNKGWKITYTSCCRISNSVYNADKGFRVWAYVDANAFQAGQEGPISIQKAVTTIPRGSEQASLPFIPGYDKEDGGPRPGGTLRFRWATVSEMGAGTKVTKRVKNGDSFSPPMLLSAETGKLTWDTRTVKKGQYSVSVVVTDSSQSETVVDWIVQVVDPAPKTCSAGCPFAEGQTCYKDSDCSFDQCGVTVTAARRLNAAVAGRATLSGTGWTQSRHLNTRTRRHTTVATYNMQIAKHGKLCPTGTLAMCHKAGQARRRGNQRRAIYCKRAGYCWDNSLRGRPYCFSKVCVPTSFTPESQRMYSSVLNDDPVGTRHARSTINSPQAWSARHNDNNQHITIDLLDAKVVLGVLTQGRTNCCNQYVKSFSVQYSTDHQAWENVDNGAIFLHNTVDKGKVIETRFGTIVTARYIRIKPLTWNSHISMRADVVLQTNELKANAMALTAEFKAPPFSPLGKTVCSSKLTEHYHRCPNGRRCRQIIRCPSGQKITAVDFASYGLPFGSCGHFKANSRCDARVSKQKLEHDCLNRHECTVFASNTVFGDPCRGRLKHLYVQVTCTSNAVVPSGEYEVYIKIPNYRFQRD